MTLDSMINLKGEAFDYAHRKVQADNVYTSYGRMYTIPCPGMTKYDLGQSLSDYGFMEPTYVKP